MAFIANTAFEARITNGINEDLANITGKYQASSADADCSAGLLCVRTSRMQNEGFPSGVLNENAWIMNAAAATATMDDVIYACNPYNTQQIGDGTGNLYYVGMRTLGLGIPAGQRDTFTRIDFDGESVYRFGAGNVTVNTTGDTFFTIADGLLTSQTAKPTDAGTIYFELRGTGNFTEGASASFGYYDLCAKKVSFAAGA